MKALAGEDRLQWRTEVAIADEQKEEGQSCPEPADFDEIEVESIRLLREVGRCRGGLESLLVRNVGRVARVTVKSTEEGPDEKGARIDGDKTQFEESREERAVRRWWLVKHGGVQSLGACPGRQSAAVGYRVFPLGGASSRRHGIQ